MNKTTDKKQTIVYFTIFVILFALVILPVIAVFSEAVIVDGRFDFSNALRTVIDKENLTTITNSPASWRTGCNRLYYYIHAAGAFAGAHQICQMEMA